MNVRKFIALTARDGLHKVKEILGDDAIILSNRTIPGGVEIMAVAAHDMEMMVPSTPPLRKERPLNEALISRASTIPDAPPQGLSAENDVVSPRDASLPDPYPLPSRVTPDAVAAHNTLATSASTPTEIAAPPSPVEQTAASVPPPPQLDQEEIMGEIRSLKNMVEQHMAGMAWGEAGRSEPIKTEILRQMLDAGFSPKFAREILASLPRDFTVTQALNWVKRRADRAFLTIDAQTDIVDRGGIYALVGPTGVGKTTTAAKLAARCVLRHGSNKVALITTDGYRIGAHEQLRIYGRILGVPVQLAKDATELKQTLLDLEHKHMVLIDTMGASQRDKVVAEQAAMFEANNVKRLLVLSATGRGDTLDDVVRAYAANGLTGCVLSKVDEAISLATALDVIIRHRFRLHYVSNGQRVPEDLHLPNRTYLLHRAFKGFPESSPHHLDGLEPGLLMANASENLMTAGGSYG